MSEYARGLLRAVDRHEEWRDRCLNLIPSENVTGPLVRRMLASDMGHRYYWDEPWYGGQRFTGEVERLTVEAARHLFHAGYANVRPLSGHISLMAVLLGLLKPGDTIVTSSFENGGYPLNLQVRFPLRVHHFPYLPDRYTMDGEGAAHLVEQVRPKLVVLGASILLFPHPVEEVAEAAKSVGAVVLYDGSHVLGLIAGGLFQDPFGEGADVLVGSTHKTLPGPQGGLVTVKEEGELAERIDLVLSPPPILVDNFHMNRVAGLGVALAEMIRFGEEYARQVVRNARTLAAALHEGGLHVWGAEKGFTASHQVLIPAPSLEEGRRMRDRLEEADIIVDAGVRLGTQELTRRGMGEEEMEQVAELICDLLVGGLSPRSVKRRVHKLTAQFQEVHYCFDAGGRPIGGRRGGGGGG